MGEDLRSGGQVAFDEALRAMEDRIPMKDGQRVKELLGEGGQALARTAAPRPPSPVAAGHKTCQKLLLTRLMRSHWSCDV